DLSWPRHERIMQRPPTKILRSLLPTLLLAGCVYLPPDDPDPAPDPAICEMSFIDCVNAAQGDPMLVIVCEQAFDLCLNPNQQPDPPHPCDPDPCIAQYDMCV